MLHTAKIAIYQIIKNFEESYGTESPQVQGCSMSAAGVCHASAHKERPRLLDNDLVSSHFFSVKNIKDRLKFYC